MAGRSVFEQLYNCSRVVIVFVNLINNMSKTLNLMSNNVLILKSLCISELLGM